MSKGVKNTDPSIKRRRYKQDNLIPGGGNPSRAYLSKGGLKKGSLIGDVLLENEFILTQEMNKKYAKHTYGIFHKKWRRNTFMAGCLLMILAFVFLYVWKLYFLWGLLLLIGLYVFIMSWLGYLYGASNSYRGFKEFYGEPVTMKVQFYEKFFRVVTPMGNRDFLYANIIKRMELPDMAILIVAQEGIIRHGQIIDKKAFEPLELSKYYDILEAAEVQIS